MLNLSEKWMSSCGKIADARRGSNLLQRLLDGSFRRG
jgi:hypothetical protein